jgi:hypothetical protein
MGIIQGDNGITVPFIVPLKLEGATVKVAIKRGGELINKTATVLDVVKGHCEFTLLSSDLTVIGNYKYQWTAEFEDGRIKSGKSTDLYVSEKLTGVPPTSGGGDIMVSVDGGEF